MVFTSWTAILAGLAALSLVLQGCASPGVSVTQTLRVETPGCERASCELVNDRGKWLLEQTPGEVALTTSSAPLQVSCRAGEGPRWDTGVSSGVSPTTGAGAVAGGVAGGAAVGAAVGTMALSYIPALGAIAVISGVAAGAATGQAAEASRRAIRYPDVITVSMSCPAAAVPPRPGSVTLGLGVRGLPPAQTLAAGAGERGAVLVTGVADGGPAAKAGLRVGDILLAADGHDLHDAADLEELVRALAPGRALTLSVWRAGQLLSLALTLPAAVP
jgi:hypothetical protein